MSKIAVSSPATGTATFTLTAPGGTSTDRTINLPDAGGDMVLTTATQTLTNKTIQSSTIQGGALTLATAVTASGTSVDFTSIPSWVKRITVMFVGVSLSGTSSFLLRLGDSGGVQNSGYSGGGSRVTFNAVGGAAFTNGFGFNNSNAAALYSGNIVFCLVTGNTWTASGTLGATSTEFASILGGSKTLSDTLDRIRITTVNGTDTFDAGTINIIYEG